METPVLLLIFNRPELTQRVFDTIKLSKPKHLFIAADGPREEVPDDILKCKLTREIVLNHIDWECDVKTLIRTTNLGCGLAVSEAITWLFSYVDQGIILEDDCIPNLSFFGFCSDLLKKYESEDVVMHITGTNFNDGVTFGEYTYFFTKYPFIWGWATWKRAWAKYDYELNDIRRYHKIIESKIKDPFERKFWRSRIELIKTNVVNTWDYQWIFSIWAANGICITSNFNLVSNIGFGSDSTHNRQESKMSNLTNQTLVKIVHPKEMIIIKNAERSFVKNVLNIEKAGYINFYLQRLRNLVHKIQNIIHN